MNPLARARRPAGGSGDATVGGPPQAMGSATASTTPRPRHKSPRAQASGVPAHVGGRGAGYGHRRRHRAKSGYDQQHPPPLATLSAALRGGPVPFGPAVADHGEVSTRTATGIAQGAGRL